MKESKVKFTTIEKEISPEYCPTCISGISPGVRTLEFTGALRDSN